METTDNVVNQHDQTINRRKLGQRRFKCNIRSCEERGRILGRLGKNIVMAYCPTHRKKGERVLGFLVNSLMRYRLTNLLQDAKQQIFMKNEPKLCDSCQTNIAGFVNNMISKLDKMETLMPVDQLDPNSAEEFADAE
ncbi:MAG: hypothetical protein Q8O88_01170 [bacterium]|nr:hypothetical protein [bacterium]